MKYRILIVISFSLIFANVPVKASADKLEETNNQISAALNSGNAAELSIHFNSMVDCGITGNEDTYSKVQASRILQDFFKNNPVKSFKITKQGNSTDGSQYSIGELKAGNKIFRVYYLLKKISDSYLIQQLQIQEEH
jgi:hypothetical protein